MTAALLLTAAAAVFASPALAAGLHVLRDGYAEVRESFNERSGELRFIAILSPT
jgi:hypothetical protein